MIKANDRLDDNSVKLSYKLIENLLYFNDDEKGLRLYISSVMKAEIFKLAHDEMRHPRYARTHKRLTQDLYIYNMTIKLHEFIRHYPHCQLNQTPRHKLYDLLQLIFSSARPFHTLIIDFILALSKTIDEMNCAIKVIDKFSKTVTFIVNKIT